MANNTEISILVTLKDQASQAMQSMAGTLKSMEPAFKSMATIGAVGFGAVSAVAIKSLGDFAQAEAAIARVDATLATMGEKGKGARDSIMALSAATLKLGFDDEAAAESLTMLFQRTGDMTKATELNNLAMDLARAKNIGLSEASKMVGMVLSGNGKALKAYGIEIDETKGPLAALGELHNKVGGQAEAFAKTTAGQAEILKNSMGNLSESIGASLQPALQKLFTIIEPVLTKFMKWVEENPKLVANILLVVGAISGLLLVVGTLGLVIPSIIAGVTALGTAFLFLSANPIGMLIVAIGLLVAAVAYIVTHWEEVKGGIIIVWTAITEFLTRIWNGIKDTVMRVFTAVGDFFYNAWVGMKNTAKNVMEGIGNVIIGVWEGIKNTVKSSINWILDKINSVIRAVNDAMSKVSGKLGFGAINIPQIPLMAKGGIVNGPTLAMIGEAGPEAVIPLSRLGQFAGAGGNNITLNFTGTFGQGAAEEIGDMIVDRLMLNMKL